MALANQLRKQRMHIKYNYSSFDLDELQQNTMSEWKVFFLHSKIPIFVLDSRIDVFKKGENSLKK